jgi:hypothetical protein
MTARFELYFSVLRGVLQETVYGREGGVRNE